MLLREAGVCSTGFLAEFTTALSKKELEHRAEGELRLFPLLLANALRIDAVGDVAQDALCAVRGEVQVQDGGVADLVAPPLAARAPLKHPPARDAGARAVEAH